MDRSILIRGVRAVDTKRDECCDILIQSGKIEQMGENLSADADIVLDGTGLVAMPGLFDMHVHFRDPGQTHKEDLQTGCAAALAGGVTGVLCMPNTTPPMDSAAQLSEFLARAKETGVEVCQAGCLTMGLQGKELADYPALKTAGAAALSDDGKPVPTAELMEQALRNAAAAGLPVVSHCEDLAIIDGGIINKGIISEQLGVKGMDRRSEDSITQRDIDCAAKANASVHICHVSTRGSVDAVRKAKAAGVQVTCETAPHYFTLTEEKLLSRDADYRMNPPLRTEDDKQAIIEGILDGTIDCIITDHAPHAANEKAVFEKAPNGVVGLETSLAATLTALYHTGLLTLQDIVRLMSETPRRLLGLAPRTLSVGADADLILVNTNLEWTVVPEQLHSKSHNTVFKGMTFKGKPVMTITNGIIRYTDASAKIHKEEISNA
ncbi:MAG: dihydroorotase [Oscillospiraceae bacterium]|nr:dihydroorotase [Oscillospiraceae bacterium]